MLKLKVIKNKPLRLKVDMEFPKIVPANFQEKTVIPTKEQTIVEADTSYDGLSKVVVEPISDDYVIPNGILEVTSNGEHNVKEYEKVLTNIHEQVPYKPRHISFSGYTGTNLDYELANLDTSDITNMENMFSGCSNLITLDISNFDVSNVTNINGMFNGCSKISNIKLPNFTNPTLTDIGSLFYACGNLTTVDLSKMNTSNVTDMSYLFYNCSSLTNIDLSNFDTSKVTTMYYMFRSCSRLERIDISNFVSKSNLNSQSMFNNCTNLKTLIINNENIFRMSNVNMLSGTAIANGTGYIYVPDNMVDAYKSATNWSTYASQIKGISELTEV